MKGINHLIGNKISYDQVAQSIIKEFGNIYNIEFKEPDTETMSMAYELEENKYATKEWTYKK